jgi:hypothetical protein
MTNLQVFTLKKFKAIGIYQLPKKGMIYYGYAPFTFERSKSLLAFSGQWEIDHPEAIGKVFRVVGVESHCIQTIRAGATIGLLVEQW